MLGNLLQDLRYSARMLRKNPVFSAVAILVLALGIGANTVIFSLVDVVLFRPLPVAHPEELVRLFAGETRGGARWHFISLPAYEAYRDHSDAFSGLAAYVDRFPVNASTGKFGAERVDAGMVTGNYFQVLGANAGLGRTLVPDDDRPGAPPVVMLGHSFWRRHYPSGASALGSQILVDGQWFTVVGVTPAGFGGISFENFPGIWIPLAYAVQIDPLLKGQIPLNHESFAPFGVVGRLKPGTTLAQTQAHLDAIAPQLGVGTFQPGEGPQWKRPWPSLVPAAQAARQTNAKQAFLLLGIVALVLLIACADLAGLMLARSETRQKEIAVRLALGGSRRRIMMLHLSEALLVSALGAIVGCVLAAWGAHVVAFTAPAQIDLPLERAASILDLRVLAFTGLIALLAALLSALVPAIKYSRADLALAIQGSSSRTSAVGRGLPAQAVLVVLQVAASVVLLVGAGLLTRTLWHASQIQLGFDPAHTVFGSTDLIRQGYEKNAAATLLDPMLDALRAQPGVEAAALGPVPLQGNMSTSVKLEGYKAADGELVAVEGLRVSPGYFATLRIPLLSGRDFRRSDAAGAAGAAIVSQSFARKYWPGGSAVGRHIEGVGIHAQAFEIVGVVGDTAGYDLRRGPRPVVYFPLDQSYLMFPWQPDVTLLARGPGDLGQLMDSLRHAVAAVDSALPLFRARALQDQVAGVLGEEKFLARLLIVFAVIAMTLSAAGIFGLMSYSTERATHDFGVRLALGAQTRHILWMVLQKGLVLAITGLIASLLFGVGPTDAVTFAGVGVLIVLIALLACYVPARRATQVDPLVALRSE
jgi:putative ABC transport system permease protein